MPQASIVDGTEKRNIERAAGMLRRGGLVAFPTETVYGLGADALKPEAVCRLFEVKKRPAFNPVIVHVRDGRQAMSLWKETPPIAWRLMKRFWPGPLTIVLPKTRRVPDVVTGGLETVAVRMPRHPVALDLLRRFGGPIAAPSANLFGCTSPTSARAVKEELGARIGLILDGGRPAVGVESTVIKIDGSRLVILRPGGITPEQLKQFSATVVMAAKGAGTSPESPGLLPVHYAPQTPLFILNTPFAKFLERLEKLKADHFREKGNRIRIGMLYFKTKKAGAGLFCAAEVLSSGGGMDEAASNLFQALRKLDKMGLDLIVAEPVSRKGIGLAIMDRLEKASGGRRTSLMPVVWQSRKTFVRQHATARCG